MRSFFLHICVLCVALLCLSSCGFDKERDYVFHFEVQARFQDEDNWKLLEEYFKENYVNDSKHQTIHGTSYGAYEKALDLFEQGRKNIDYLLIFDAIQDPEDIVVLLGVLTGDKSNEVVCSTYWDYDLKQEFEQGSIAECVVTEE